MQLPDGFVPEFAFTIRPSSSFNDSGVADVPVGLDTTFHTMLFLCVKTRYTVLLMTAGMIRVTNLTPPGSRE